jgi:hypothetical protein
MVGLASNMHRGRIEWGSVADWVMVLVTLRAAPATVAAVGIAVWTAASASRTARDTEKARVAEAQARANSAYGERLSRALVRCSRRSALTCFPCGTGSKRPISLSTAAGC